MAELRTSCKMDLRLRPRVTRSYNERLEEEERESNKSSRMLNFGYNILDKLKEDRFSTENGLLRHFKDGRELSCKLLQSTGFLSPMVFHSSEGLQMKLPLSTFSISDIKHLVGGDRIIDVVDSTSQEALTMSLSQFCEYYQNVERGRERKRILNVISLEFSHTKMDPFVEAPQVVRELDWVNKVWPQSLLREQTDPTNDLRKMMYPKVQKYCLLSVPGCYTDFHLDFGGTSVWYHVLRGEKIFFLIPPSQDNYSLFHDWQKHGRQECVFFPDIVKECGVVQLREGDTLLMPSGWIHGVYTPKQSVVFGGNFLLSLHIAQQLTVAYIERDLKVQGKFRYPFYGSLHWYVVRRYHQQLARLGIEPISDTEEKEQSPSLLPGRWLVSVKLKKLPLSGKKIKEANFSSSRDVIECSSMPLVLPYMSSNEREGLMLLVRKMREDCLFSGDVPPAISDPRGILDRLFQQLQNSRLHTVISAEPTGRSLLDNLWAEPPFRRTGQMSSGSINEVGMAVGEVVDRKISGTGNDHVTFDDDFLSTELLSGCFEDEGNSQAFVDISSEKPVLRVNHDHSYGQFITQTSPALNPGSAHPLIAQSPTHLLMAQTSDYPILLTPNPSHQLLSPPAPAVSSLSTFNFSDVLSSSNDKFMSSSGNFSPVTPSLTSPLNQSFFSQLPAPYTSASPRQQEATPLASIATPFSSLSTSPSPSNVAKLSPVLPPSGLKLPLLHNETPPSTLTTPLSLLTQGKPIKKRRRSTKEQTKPLRKVRCGQCMECTQEPCGVCKFCLDSPKYGGTGKLRKACLHRRCSNMQFSKTSVVSPLATTPTSLLCEQRPADSTTSLGEDPLPFLQTAPVTPLTINEHNPASVKTEGRSTAVGNMAAGSSNMETTVMAMGYAVGSSDTLSEDIDLAEILGSNDTNLFSTSVQQLSHEVTDPLLSPPFLHSFLTSPTFQSSSPFTSPSLNPPLTHNTSPLIDHEFQLHLSDEEFKQ